MTDTVSVCPHLLAKGLNQPLVGVDLGSTAGYMCNECTVNHVLHWLMVDWESHGVIAHRLNFENCGHLETNQCARCYVAFVARMTLVLVDARLSGNTKTSNRINTLLSTLYKRHGAGIYLREKL